MKYFQRALNNSNSFCECKKNEATHYTNSDGDMKPIGQLLKTNVNNNFVANVPTHSPLGVPSMDKLILKSNGEEQPIRISKNNELGLGVPSLTDMIMSESKKRNKYNSQNKKPIKNENYDKNGLPSLDAMIKGQSR